MFHHAGLLNFSKMKSQGLVSKVSRDILEKYIDEEKFHLESNEKVVIASKASISFLIKNFDRYNIYIVDQIQNGQYYHVYGVKKARFSGEVFEDILNKSFNEKGAISFFDSSMLSKKNAI